MATKGKVLVTGANSGLGLATALELARRGHEVVGSVRSEAKAEVLHDAAAATGVEVAHVLMDVTDATACEGAMAEVGPLAALVNNAGGGGTGAIEDVSDEEARQTLEAMVVAPMRLARLAIPGMRAAGHGRIVNVSSIYGKASTPLTGWYQAAKHALEGVSDALRMEVARDGIAVVLVEPGGFKTAIFDSAHDEMARRPGSAYRRQYDRTSTLTRLSEPFMGNPERVARVVAGAIEARRPRDRYLVGIDAQAIALATRVVPTPVMDRVTRLTLGL